MTWTKLGDEFPAAARRLTDAEYRTHVEALCWSNLRLLDLYVPKDDVRRFAESPDAAAAVDGLLAKGWWEDRDDDWYIGIHFPEWQEERVVVDKRREDAAQRKRRSRLHKAGDHSMCIPGGACPNVTRDKTRDKTRDGTRRRGRVGTGPTDPADPPEDQKPVAGSAPLVTTQGFGDGESPSQEQPNANSLPRVHVGPGNDGPDAQQIPPHDSESPAADRYARASETGAQADGSGSGHAGANGTERRR